MVLPHARYESPRLVQSLRLNQSPQAFIAEKASLRLVVQAIYDYLETAIEIFREEGDLVADIGEDITREALDKMGVAKIVTYGNTLPHARYESPRLVQSLRLNQSPQAFIADQRLFGKIDYKRARYLFHPDYAIRQALFVDSKAEKVDGQRTATLQTSQFSMLVRQVRAGEEVNVAGNLPKILTIRDTSYITTTIFVKYNYRETAGSNELKSVTVAAVPNGLLQNRYNPSAHDTIWLAGRNAPSLGEAFRVRLSFSHLQAKAGWCVQKIPLVLEDFVWCD